MALLRRNRRKQPEKLAELICDYGKRKNALSQKENAISREIVAKQAEAKTHARLLEYFNRTDLLRNNVASLKQGGESEGT